MFILYQSNNIKSLKNIFFYVIKNYIFMKKKKKIFYPTEVVIPDYNMSFYLKMFLSKKLGICSNFKFILPAKFIWNIYKKIIPDIKEEYFFNKTNLVWIIMYLLPKLIYLDEFYIIKKYLYNDLNNDKLFSLSYQIADIYDKYLMYRIDWLYSWEKYKLIDNLGDNQIWQSILWRKIISFFLKKFNFVWNRCNVYYKVLDILNLKKKNNFLFENKRSIFIFNVSYLSPIYLNTFYILSKYIDVNYFFINLSCEYWFDICNFKDYNYFNKNYFCNLSLDKYKNFNPLLLNCGKICSDYLLLLNEFDFYEINCFSNFKNKSVLNIIKNDILYFKNSFFLNNKKIKDNSIKIYSCSGYLNEVKKLRKFLFKLIINNLYNVFDIVVFVSNLSKYYSYIYNVFSDIRYKKYLPFRIIENNLDFDNNILNLFLSMLNIYYLDNNFNDICLLLKNKVISNKFNINIDELNIIFNIIKNIGLCNCINDYLFNLSFNDLNYFTIVNGIKRILLGYAINEEFCIWNNIVPYSYINNNFFYGIIEKLSNFLFNIIDLRNILSKKYLINDWINISKKILDIFFDYNIVNKNIYLNNKIWFKLENSCKFIFFKNKINSFLFIKIIISFIKNINNVKLYSINSINFCSFGSLRMIPFKVVCLLGMNDNFFPKNKIYYNFDLINSNPRIGDRNKIDSDKFIFLESIISSKYLIYISYLNYSFDKNKKYFPSMLITNLLDYINSGSEYKYINKKNNFYIKNYIIKNNLKKNIFYINLKKYDDFFNKKYIFLNNFCYYWFNPIKYFFNFFLKINYHFFDNFFFNKELFIFDIKKFYFFRFKIINILLNRKILYKNIFYILQYLNILPLFSFGKIIWYKEKTKIFNLINNIKNLFFKIKEFKFNCLIDKINIYGIIHICDGYGVIKWLPKNLNLIDALIFWINHLIYCYLGGKNYSYIYGYNGVWSFPPINYSTSKKYLRKYLFGYFDKNNFPVFFLPRSSNMWFYYAYDLKKKKKKDFYLLNLAKRKLKNILYGNYFYNGELNDIYISRFIKDFNFKVDIENIILCSEIWLLPVFKNLIVNNK